MFNWHETTRIFLCRVAFLLLVVGPTLFVTGLAWRYRSPQYLEARREEWVAVLSDKLGYEVSIANVSYPTWDTALLEEVALRDPETQVFIAAARSLEITAGAETWHVAASYPRVDAQAIETLYELFHDRLLRMPQAKFSSVEFTAGVLACFQGKQEQTFSNVSCRIVPANHGKVAKIRFTIDGVKAPQPWELTLERHSAEQPPHTIATFPTGDATVPLQSLQVLFPWLTSFGPTATYRGEIRTIHYGRESLIELSGQLQHVDLERLVSEHLPHHKLSGQADIQISALQLHNGSIALAKGSLRTVQGGEISSSLLAALSQKLHLAPPQPPKLNPFTRVRFSHLAFGFQLDSQGLAISGDADPSEAGVVMASAAAGTLLRESEPAVLPVVCLVDALSPPSTHKIPATPEAKTWIELLPAPALLPEEVVETAHPPSNLRLRK
jgi:hypothetical protein